MIGNIDLYVVENHNEVLEPLYRKIGSKKLPFKGMCLLHFDSHADMSVPKELMTSSEEEEEEGILSKHDVFRHADIESWILPTLYSEHVDCVAWLHPYWTQQSFPEESFFKVGHSVKDRALKVTSSSNHFLSEESFEFEGELGRSKEVRLVVRKVDPGSDGLASQSSEVVGKLRDVIRTHGDVFVLDIDLDFFSTKDPFKDAFSRNHYDILKQAYKFVPPLSQDEEGLKKCMKQRKEQLCCLKKCVSDWASGVRQESCIQSDDFRKMLSEISGTEEDYDWLWLHEVGTGIDDCPLPDHISSEEEVDEFVRWVGVLLCLLPPPAIIFVSRSSEDDYCPVNQVEMIQGKVLKMLDQTYKNINKTLLYESK